MPGGALEAAVNGSYAGTTVTVDGPFADADAVKFDQSMKAFEDATGIDVVYIGSKEFEGSISVRVGTAGDASVLTSLTSRSPACSQASLLLVNRLSTSTASSPTIGSRASTTSPGLT